MSDGKEQIKFREDNRGASLILVLVVFVVMLVVVTNLLMLVSAGTHSVEQEYETEQTELYLASIYEILNKEMETGTWKDAFITGETISIDVTGFQDGEGNAMPVSIKVSLERTMADVEYLITYGGEQYSIVAKYSCRKEAGVTNIALRYCQELKKL